MEASGGRSTRLLGAIRNVGLTQELFDRGDPPGLIGTVSGSASARAFWEHELAAAKALFRARKVVSLHEDLPVNQAFGLLLLWQRIREEVAKSEGALVAFVFGEGTRATPFTETDLGQKPAMASFVSAPVQDRRRYLTMVELALRYFAPVEAHLRRSGFDGVVVKWGDEVQIPTRDLSGLDRRFAGADVVRFVSMQAMTDESAVTKDWVGVNAAGEVTAFIPRRPMREMARLAERGLLERRGSELIGGINLGSIAVSRSLLDALLEEFRADILDPHADRRTRPDLDPQLFTALTIATQTEASARMAAWNTILAESAPMRDLERNIPDILARLRRALDAFERRHQRGIRMMALDFQDQFWGDVGQHRQICDFYMALNDRGEVGDVARAIAGIAKQRDDRGNLIVGHSVVADTVDVEESVLIDVRLTGRGRVTRSVLVGTTAHDIVADCAFDVLSTVRSLDLAPRAGAYKLVSDRPIRAASGERWTTVFLPDGELDLRVGEDTDLRDRERNYDRPVLGNALSFEEAHRIMMAERIEDVEARRRRRVAEILGL